MFGSLLEQLIEAELDAAGKLGTVEGEHLLTVTRLLAGWPSAEGMAAISAEHGRLLDKVLPNRRPPGRRTGTIRTIRPIFNDPKGTK